MAMTACHECGKEVSNKAKSCPHCGVKSPGKEKQKGIGWGPGCLIIIALIIVGSLFIESEPPPITGSAQGGLRVTGAEFGDAWPFTVAQGIVDCPEPSTAVFRSGGVAYGLNGIADSRGYPDIEPIWRDAEIAGLKVNIGPMINLALQQCR